MSSNQVVFPPGLFKLAPLLWEPPKVEVLYGAHVVIHYSGDAFTISARGGPFTIRVGGDLAVLSGSVQITSEPQIPITMSPGDPAKTFVGSQSTIVINTGTAFCQMLVVNPCDWVDDRGPAGERPVDPVNTR